MTAAVVKISAGLDCETVSPLGSVLMPESASFIPHHSVNARVVSSRGFDSAAGFCMFQLWVWEGTATATLSATHPNSIAESFLDIGNVVVRCQGTPRARVQVVVICGRHACGTGLRFSSLAAKHLWRGVRSSDA